MERADHLAEEITDSEKGMESSGFLNQVKANTLLAVGETPALSLTPVELSAGR
jgi:hypothetical protein